MSSPHINLTVGLMVCVPLTFLVLWILNTPPKPIKKKYSEISFLYSEEDPVSQRDIIELASEHNFKTPQRTNNFRIFNSTNKEIGVYFSQPLNSTNEVSSPNIFGEERFISKISPKKSITVKGRVFHTDNVLRFSVWLNGIEEKLYDYIITSNPRRNVLMIGMRSLRYIGHAYDKSRAITTTASNAVRGQPWVTIHNPSYRTLSLNEGRIKVAPHSQTIFKGYTHTGVPLGQIFSDDDGIYGMYVYTKPYSDIYFGIVSDISQTDEGCWQLEFHDQCDFGQTLWPMEEGIY